MAQIIRQIPELLGVRRIDEYQRVGRGAGQRVELLPLGRGRAHHHHHGRQGVFAGPGQRRLPRHCHHLARRQHPAVEGDAERAGLGLVHVECLLEARGARQRLQANALEFGGQKLRRPQPAGLAGAAALHIVGGQGAHYASHGGGRNGGDRNPDGFGGLRPGLGFHLDFGRRLGRSGQGGQQAAQGKQVFHP